MSPREGALARTMEISGTAVGRLGEQALAHHEHAIAIRITITYYLNANVNASPGRLRKSQLRYGWHSFRHPQGCLVTWSRVG